VTLTVFLTNPDRATSASGATLGNNRHWRPDNVAAFL